MTHCVAKKGPKWRLNMLLAILRYLLSYCTPHRNGFILIIYLATFFMCQKPKDCQIPADADATMSHCLISSDAYLENFRNNIWRLSDDELSEGICHSFWHKENSGQILCVRKTVRYHQTPYCQMSSDAYYLVNIRNKI